MKRRILLTCMAAAFLSAYTLAQTVPGLRANNIDKIVKAMTLEEKARLLVGGNTMGKLSGSDHLAPRTFVNGAAGITCPLTRLGIPPTLIADGPVGIRIEPTRTGTDHTFYAMCYPMSTLMACTWDMPLVEQEAEVMGNEVREYGCDILLGPGMNIQRNVLGGRNFEYYSEDPLLSGKSAAANIRGLQRSGVGACAKHFAVNSQEGNRLKIDERVSQRVLREIYLRNFEIALREGNPWTVMSSYNAMNGPYTQENRELLTDVLRNDWGWKGLVMTDWTGRRNTVAQVQAGNDLLEPGRQPQVDDIINGVKEGKLDIKDVDRGVRRVLEMIVKTPRFRHYDYSESPDMDASARMIRQAAAEGMVLLKNDSLTLPLEVSRTGRVALFGVNAYDVIIGGGGAAEIHCSYKVNLDEGLSLAGFKLDEKLADLYRAYIHYVGKLHEGAKAYDAWLAELNGNRLPGVEPTTQYMERAAKETDIAIITIGRHSREGYDRSQTNNFCLNEKELRQVSQISKLFHQEGKKVVVVLNVAGPVETESWSSMADAILVSWLPGNEAGNSIADVLTGKTTPSGHLSMTWPCQYKDDPSAENFPPLTNSQYVNHEEDIYVGYRYYDSFGKPVSYPFGFGLSYTQFAMSQPVVAVKGKNIVVSVTVRNVGERSGKGVAQVYVAAPAGTMEKPAKELKAFAKTRELKPGESQTLTMQLSVRDLASFDVAHSQWLVDSGLYTFMVGESVNDIKASTQVKLGKYTERVSNVLAPKQSLKTLSRGL